MNEMVDEGNTGIYHVVAKINAAARKILYRRIFLSIYHGCSRGAGKRIKLPKCIITGVHDAYPSKEYMGHKDA